MERIFLKIIAVCLLISACSKNNDQDTAQQTKLQGPIQPPVSGYGADGRHQVGETSFANPRYAGTRVTIFYPLDMDSPRPTIFFSHPFGGEDKEYNRGLFEFIAKKGYVVVFVPYPTFGVSVDERYNTLWAGFTKAAADYTNIVDTKKVGFMGHSFGGGASIGLAWKGFTEKGWGQDGRFLFTMAPWYSYQITSQQLAGFPSNVKMITQVYDEDDTNDHRIAIDIFKNINIAGSEKDFIYFKSSAVAGYTYHTDHVLPNSRSAFDALDYYGVYRLLDAMIDYSFNNNQAAKTVALGNGSSEQVIMPGYNGQMMAPLIVTDNPTPQYPQSKYLFPCGSSENPRIGNCE
ncbi:alpha/beta hydrolase family protein [Pararcticibacter amylolyticus]|uniref:Alpha/beta hydrolase n=1 Tax=Pararcticibacter amylolyticus TaxID=2173175 RepID=A0A2U2PCY8_9SPHI|nr:alpha/beta hydrolase [Pararcticibacter amylolyticus]PWG79255.1 alpha/beta hydrolase [Pararcticibacter amylolyticus]